MQGSPEPPNVFGGVGCVQGGCHVTLWSDGTLLPGIQRIAASDVEASGFGTRCTLPRRFGFEQLNAFNLKSS